VVNVIDDIEPIPAELLNMTATLKRAISKDNENNIVFEEINLENIRIDFARTITRNKEGNEIVIPALMFFDVTSSTPKGVVFQEEDEIECNLFGKEFRFKIASVEPAIAFSIPVFWIIGLI
jgi:Phage protein Gp9.